jgi:type II secretory pathway pseudopilin PulG
MLATFSHRRPDPRADSGMTLIEVIISALLVALIAIGTLTGLTDANRVSGTERTHAQAAVIAQQDEERLHGSPVFGEHGLAHMADFGGTTQQLAENGLCVEQVAGKWKYASSATFEATPACGKTALASAYAGQTYTGTVYTAKSSAEFFTPTKEALSCETENGSAEVVKTTSSVTWTGPGAGKGVTQSSLVKIPTEYALIVKVKNRNNEPVPGVPVKLTTLPPSSESLGQQTTPSSGCVMFGYLKQKTVDVSLETSWVNLAGESPPPAKEETMSTTSISTAEFIIEAPGAIVTEFYNNGAPVPSFTFAAVQPEIPYGEVVGGSSTEAKTTAELGKLFPFKTAYTIYAGACTANATTEAEGEKPALVEPNKTTPVRIEVPSVNTTIYEGESSTSTKGALPRTSVYSAAIINPGCEGVSVSSGPVPHEYPVTIENGKLVQHYLPYASTLKLCIDALVEGKYYESTTTFGNTSKSGTNLTIYMKAPGNKKSSTGKTC